MLFLFTIIPILLRGDGAVMVIKTFGRVLGIMVSMNGWIFLAQTMEAMEQPINQDKIELVAFVVEAEEK